MKKILYVIVLLLFIALFGCNKNNNNELTVIGTDGSTGSTQNAPKKNNVNISTLETMDYAGYQKILQDNKGKVVLLNFFGSWCAPCKAETPDFIEVYEKYKDKNFVIIGLAVDNNVDDAVKFVNNFGVTYPVYQASEDLIKYFRVGPIPTSLLFDKNGKYLDQFIGYMDKSIAIQIAELGGK